ncbi:restriction endonuclease subunit S [Thermophilibacter mediterraneus]|uniref:restriction endonuclease subunit S n=1 Tax=Thermophilibacter mediterraneus TaxID=1871031 RepID=UPI00235756E5|nr:restriction endonuclease subunit S [Thermophilibacter mediterraneus]
MKDSGIPWIGDIPSSWTVEKVKGCLRRHDVKGHGDATVLSLYRDHGVVPKDSRDDNYNRTGKDTGSYKYVREGDLVINKMKAWQGSLSVSGYDGIVSPAYFVYEFWSGKLDKGYADYLLRFAYKQEFKRVSGGIREGQWDLPAYEFEHMPIPLPPLSEQRRIADYLDERCGAIDMVKKSIEGEVEALRRLRAATIFKAVTKGLDDDVPVRDSEIGWVGTIPESWRIGRIGGLYRQRNIKVNDEDYPPLSVTKNGIVPQIETAAKSNDHGNRKLVKVGDFVINSRSDRRGSCGISMLEGSVSLINTVLEPRDVMAPSYYNHLFHTAEFADEFYRWGHGIVDDLWTTRWQDMKSMKVPLPPIEEQRYIADYLDERCAAIDSVIEARTQQLERLEDYRKALIYAYATGKKEVPAS